MEASTNKGMESGMRERRADESGSTSVERRQTPYVGVKFPNKNEAPHLSPRRRRGSRIWMIFRSSESSSHRKVSDFGTKHDGRNPFLARSLSTRQSPVRRLPAWLFARSSANR